MSHQGALESTQTCADGLIPGSSSRVPSGSPSSSGRSLKKVGRVGPQTRQNARVSLGEELYFETRSSPVSQQNAAVGMAALVRNAAPVALPAYGTVAVHHPSKRPVDLVPDTAAQAAASNVHGNLLVCPVIMERPARVTKSWVTLLAARQKSRATW